MPNLLIVEDSAMCRDGIARLFEYERFTVRCATDGAEGLLALQAGGVDLVVLDLAMPRMNGIQMLRRLRQDPAIRHLPVIIMTGMLDPRLQAAAESLGVQGYVTKPRFTFGELLQRVRACLAEAPAPAEPAPDEPAPDVASDQSAPLTGQSPSVPEQPAAPAPVEPPIHPLPVEAPGPHLHQPGASCRRLTRDETLSKVAEFAESKTLAGVVGEIVALTSSPRTSVGELVQVLKRDPVITSRVLQVANTAAFTSNKPRVSTLEDAVRNIGLNTVRNVASSVGIFNALPTDASDGFNVIRCWQHCFAVACLMDRLLAPDAESAGAAGAAGAGAAGEAAALAHVVGLCHDVGEIVLHQCFAELYPFVAHEAQRSGRTLRQVEVSVFGVTHDELLAVLLEKLALPPTISAPILEFHRMLSGQPPNAPGLLARVLALADRSANGLLLAASPHVLIGPVTAAELRNTFGGRPRIPAIDGPGIRGEVLAYTTLLARLSPQEEGRIARPLLGKTGARIWYARHPSFAAFDPLRDALAGMGEVELFDRLPARESELTRCNAIVAIVPRRDVSPVTALEVQAMNSAIRRRIPLLALAPPLQREPADAAPGIAWSTYPLSLASLHAFLTAAAAAPRAAVT